MDTVLVIDDERNIRTLVARVLGGDDVEVHTAGTGISACPTSTESRSSAT